MPIPQVAEVIAAVKRELDRVGSAQADLCRDFSRRVRDIALVLVYPDRSQALS